MIKNGAKWSDFPQIKGGELLTLMGTAKDGGLKDPKPKKMKVYKKFDRDTWTTYFPTDNEDKEKLNELVQTLPKNICPSDFYRIVWLDKQIFEKHNMPALKAFSELGFSGFEPLEDINHFKELICSNYTKDNVILICSGEMITNENIIKYVNDSNQVQFKVRNIVIYDANVNFH